MLLCALALVAVTVAGCEKLARNMYDGAKQKPLRPSERFDDGNSSRPRVAGTVEYNRGILAATSSGVADREREARRIAAERAKAIPYPITMRLLARGRERFDIYCAPCHSRLGDGDGRIARRGFPHPPSYHIDRLRNAPDRHFYDVMTNGYGVMYPYRDRVAPEDRWAIVAYIRALQLSQDAPREALAANAHGKGSAK
ncbi:MAG TPA: cytochrome c [Usitatibacter sp.]|jgi:mono/diheme cytochrome c family protein|nr:cytochrome c [Usitatibacter sp.]